MMYSLNELTFFIFFSFTVSLDSQRHIELHSDVTSHEIKISTTKYYINSSSAEGNII